MSAVGPFHSGNTIINTTACDLAAPCKRLAPESQARLLIQLKQRNPTLGVIHYIASVLHIAQE